MLKLVDLACQRGRQILWDGIYISIAPGNILFVGGANGSGKSSLLRIIAGLSTPVKGDVIWFDKTIFKDPISYRNELIYIGHQAPLKPEFSALENVEALLQLHGIQSTSQELKDAFEYWELSDKTTRLPSKQLSQGQKQRTALAQLCLLKKKLWVLDEPFNSLDKSGSDLLSNLLQTHLSNHGFVIITSHLHRNAEHINPNFKSIEQKLDL